MSVADRVEDTSTSVGTGNVTNSGTPPVGCQPLSALGGVGTPFPYHYSNGAEWEAGEGTIEAENVWSRAPTASSNGGAPVNFSAGTKTFICTMTASRIRKLMSANTAAFSTAIPLTAPGTVYLPQQSVASVLAFSIAAGSVQGALAYVRLIADGTNAPTFAGMKEWGGSMGYDNRNGIANEVQFFYDGNDYWYSVSQAVGAVPVPVAPGAPTIGAATGGNGSASVTFTAPASNGGTAITTYTATSSPGGFTGTASSVTPITVSGLTNGTAYTFTVTATNSAGTGPASAASNSVTPAASTVPGAPTIGTATAGDASASITFTPPGSNGGSAITSYTATSSPGGFTGSSATSPVTVSGLTNGTAYTFTVKANNANGASAASAASNSVTPAAAGSVFRFASLSGMTESGTSPNFTYTSTSSSFTGCSSVGNLHRAASTDGSLAMTHPVTGANNATLLGLKTTATTGQSYTDTKYAFYAAEDGSFYRHITNGGSVTNSSVTIAANDIMRLRVSGTSVVAEVARTATPTTFIEVRTWTGDDGSALYYLLQLVNGGSVTNYVNNCTAVDLV